jgi:hypothetical protein
MVLTKYKILCSVHGWQHVYDIIPPIACPVAGGDTVNVNSVDTVLDLKYTLINSTDSPQQLTNKSLLCDTTLGDIRIELRKAKSARNKLYVIKKTSASNTITINPVGSELINGGSVYTLTALCETIELISNGTSWDVYTLSESLPDAVNFSATGDVFGSDYQYFENLGTSTTTSTSFVQKVRFTTEPIPYGEYMVETIWQISSNKNKVSVGSRCQIDDIITVCETYTELRESNIPIATATATAITVAAAAAALAIATAAAGAIAVAAAANPAEAAALTAAVAATLVTTTAATAQAAATAAAGDFYPQGSFRKVLLEEGVHNIDVDYLTNTSVYPEVSIKDIRIKLYRLV